MAEAARKCVLVVDDDADIRLTLEMLLQYQGFEVWTAKDGAEALARVETEARAGRAPAVVLTDLKMPRMTGVELLDALQRRESPPPVILISGHGDVPVAVDAMQRGAANFLEKPLEEARVLVTLRRTLREGELERENKKLKKRLTGRHELIGASPAMRALDAQIQQVADSDASVLVTGENGVGKEVVARNLHYRGARASGPFVTVNCAAIPAELVESELFGHVKGSFTGAHEDRVGHFEAANSGTLFLDEIGDMPLAAQAKVLRALESHEVIRVGSSGARPVDIRVVAATNADLDAAVEAKTFRMDLYYRLNVVPLHVPPLRERPEDVAVLARHFLAQQAERTGRAAPTISGEALELLTAQSWPGNVRQLRNTLEGAAVFANGDGIGRAEVEQILGTGAGLAGPPRAHLALGAEPYDAPTFEEFKNLSEAQFFRYRLERNEGNVKRTAEELGMQRSHLYKKLERYGLK
ncbi:MAG: sigma-54 dependent transcriptional regulator [Planctomycetota bacterium]